MTESKMLCINGERYFHRSAKQRLDEPFDLLGWLNCEPSKVKFYWKGRDGREIAASGCVLSLELPPFFETGNESAATFYGGHAFFPDLHPKDRIWAAFPRKAFFLPEREVRREGGAVWATSHQINGPLVEKPFCPGPLEGGAFQLHQGKTTPSEETWKDLITQTLKEIEDQTFDKVVMARRSTYQGEGIFNPFALLAQMANLKGIAFAIQFEEGKTFIGITPERLYKRKGQMIEAEAMAGTRKLGTDPKELLEDEKERREFSFVKDSIVKALTPLCKEVSFVGDEILKTPNVIHLHNSCTATLLSKGGDEELLSALHPTAAMGGLPKRSALEYLALREPFERGWYAAPLGYCNAEEAEFAVGIRSALVESKRIHFFAGAGIVAGSLAENEWEELEHKVSLWKVLA